MSDLIEIRGLRVLGTHGALPHEQLAPQPFEIDLRLEADLAPAGASDHLADTIDYGVVVDRVVGLVAGERFALLEALATSVTDAVLAIDGRLSAVTLTLRKMRPPLAADVSSVGVEMRRVRSVHTEPDAGAAAR